MAKFLHPYLRSSNKNTNWKKSLQRYCQLMLEKAQHTPKIWTKIFIIFVTYQFDWKVLERQIQHLEYIFVTLGIEIEVLDELLAQFVSPDVFDQLTKCAKFTLHTEQNIQFVEKFCVKLIEKDLIVSLEHILTKAHTNMNFLRSMNVSGPSRVRVVNDISSVKGQLYLKMLIKLFVKLKEKKRNCGIVDVILSSFDTFWNALSGNLLTGDLSVSLVNLLAAKKWRKYLICHELYLAKLEGLGSILTDVYKGKCKNVDHTREEFDQFNESLIVTGLVLNK